MKADESPQQKRNWVARAFTAVEDMVYLGLGVLSGRLFIALWSAALLVLAKT